MPKSLRKSKHNEAKADDTSANVLASIDDFLGDPHDNEELEILELEKAAAAATETEQAVLAILPKPISPILEQLPLKPTKSGTALVKARPEQGCSDRAKPRDVLQQGKNKLSLEAAKSLKLLKNIKKEATSPPSISSAKSSAVLTPKPAAVTGSSARPAAKPPTVSTPAQVANSTSKPQRPAESMPVLVSPATPATASNVWPPIGAFDKTSHAQDGKSLGPGAGTTSQPKTGGSGQTQARSGSTNFSRGGPPNARGWCFGDEKDTVKSLTLATPTWSQRLAGLAEYLQEPRHQNVAPVVLGIPMNQFILLNNTAN